VRRGRLRYLLLLAWQKFQQLSNFFWMMDATAAIYLPCSLRRRLWIEYAGGKRCQNQNCTEYLVLGVA